jgi:hypothetical protein
MLGMHSERFENAVWNPKNVLKSDMRFVSGLYPFHALGKFTGTMMSRRLFIPLVLAFLLISFSPVKAQAQTAITAPEAFFGFKMGSDRKIARWDKMVEYFTFKLLFNTIIQ